MSEDEPNAAEQIAGLTRDLAAARRECQILQTLVHGGRASHTASPVHHEPERPPAPDQLRMLVLEHAVEKLEDVMADIARDGCNGYDDEEPCNCFSHRAVRVIAEVRDWRFGGSPDKPSRRFVGAMENRLTGGHHPREVKIHQAWAKFANDRVLGMILSSDHDRLDWPSARDWWVATSLVQWLATNVGSAILEAADFKYTKYDEDLKTYYASKRDAEHVKAE